jgi:hypothetical protein
MRAFFTRSFVTSARIRFALALLAMALAVGTACAGFLWSLDAVTRLRFAAPWLLYGLPLCGLAVAWLYRRFGARAEGGNNLILDDHEPGGGVPLAMAPLVLIGTVATHLFGGSAGREGTAVQLGGSLAHGLVDRLGLTGKARRLLLMGGVAAGFGAVFGTPGRCGLCHRSAGAGRAGPGRAGPLPGGGAGGRFRLPPVGHPSHPLSPCRPARPTLPALPCCWPRPRWALPAGWWRACLPRRTMAWAISTSASWRSRCGAR